MKATLLILLSLTVSMPSWASFGFGLPSGHCEYNMSSQRQFEPENIAAAKKALERAEARLEELQDKYDDLDDCGDCKGVVDAVFQAVGGQNAHMYEGHLKGEVSDCTVALNTYTNDYNDLAMQIGWTPVNQKLMNYNPKRVLAGTGGEDDELAEAAPPQGNRGGTPDADNIPDADVIVIDNVQETPSGCLNYMLSRYKIDDRICTDPATSRIENYSNPLKSKCKSCLGVRNKYGNCLRQRANLEAQIASAEDRVSQAREDLEDAEDNPSDREACVNCREDRRTGLQRWAIPGVLGLVGGYLGVQANKSARRSYQEYQARHDQWQEDANRKGYLGQMPGYVRDRSVSNFTAFLAGGAPMFALGGLASGSFGCAATSSFAGLFQGGGLMGQQMGGAMGYPGGMMGGSATINGGVTAGGGMGGILGALLGGGQAGGMGGQGGWGVNGQMTSPGWPQAGGMMGAGMGVNGGAMMNPAQIQAQIAAAQQQQQMLAQQQAQLSAYMSYSQSAAALRQKHAAEMAALGPMPNVSGVFNSGMSGVGGMHSNTVLAGGFNVNAHLGMGAGVGVLRQPPSLGVPVNGAGTTGRPQLGVPVNPNVPASGTTQPPVRTIGL